VVAVRTQIVEKLYQTGVMLNNEMKQCRDYGSGHLLYHSEVHLIIAIYKHKDANVSELAQVLGITNGAVPQVANKLIQKGLIEKYRLKGNKKDIYYRLTEQGELVYWGHEIHHNQIHTKIAEYLNSLDDDKVQAIATFLDKTIESFGVAPEE
jgi:DNA-binding MarR family transcriptional regulator